MALNSLLDDEQCKILIEKAREGTKAVVSRWAKGGEGSGAAVLTRSGSIYNAGHVRLPSGREYHAEINALIRAHQENPNDIVVAVAVISTKPTKEIQYPCGHCLQDYVDFFSVLESKGQDIHPIEGFPFICARSDESYETHVLAKLLTHPWRTQP